MINVIPLKFGSAFKMVFSKPETFSRFASDVLGMPITIDQVHTEYEYPEPIGFVRSKYDLFAEDQKQRIIIEIQNVKEEDFFDRFLYYHLISLAEQVKGCKEYCFDRTVYTIVVLTSVPRDNSINFSYAVSDFSPVDEFGRRVAVYPHRIIFLVPRLVNNNTPPVIRQWLQFIDDSLDGKINETDYQDTPFQSLIEEMRCFQTNPDELASIKDEAAWEKAIARFTAEGKIEGKIEGEMKGKVESLLRLLKRRFHTIPDARRQQINDADLTTLDHWFDRAIDVVNMEAIFLP